MQLPRVVMMLMLMLLGLGSRRSELLLFAFLTRENLFGDADSLVRANSCRVLTGVILTAVVVWSFMANSELSLTESSLSKIS